MTARKNAPISIGPSIPAPEYDGVHSGIVTLVQAARHSAARSVNVLMTSTYWEIGRRLVEAEQGGKRRADYGDALIKRLAVDLTAQFGRGFGWRNLFQMRAFHLAWPDKLQTASAISTARAPTLTGRFPLPWSTYVRLLSVRDESARRFYETEAATGSADQQPVLRTGRTVAK